MLLWLLRPRDDVLVREKHPWAVPYDKTWGVLVRAASEADARRLAQMKAGLEGQGTYRRFGGDEDEIASDVWVDHAWTSCDKLEAAGEPGVILVLRR